MLKLETGNKTIIMKNNLKYVFISLLCLFAFQHSIRAQQINRIEYWVDGNSANRSKLSMTANTVIAWETLVDLPNLNNGLHTFSVRFADDSGRWSPVQSHFFVNDRNSGIYKVSKFEYWTDTNRANKIQNDFSNIEKFQWESLVNLPNLNNGLHTFSVRFADDSGRWSPVQSHFFVNDRNSGVYKVSKFEYWTDTNTANKIQNDFSNIEMFNWESLVELPNLNNGLHTFSVRFADDSGRWSPVQSHFFVKDRSNSNIVTNNSIVGYRIWFDNEKDFFPFNAHTATNSIAQINDSISVGYLPMGKHNINFQFKDLNGTWSTVLSDSIEQMDKPIFNFTATIREILVNNTVKFSPSTLHFIDSIAWSFGDGHSEVSYEPTHQFTSIGQYDVVATVWHRNATEGILYEKTKYITVTNANGIAKISSFGIKLYPIPFDNYLTVETELVTIKSIKLLLPNGKLIKEQKCNNTNVNKINVDDIPKGLYIIGIETDKGFVTTKALKN